ncbi:MAG TPA: G8 domain-containing protein [Flavisolibacter sp.]|nr:G8 domain-containing protein [Flavisolibacter sp.]
MRNLYTLLVCSLFCASSFATPVIKAKANAYWNLTSSWDLNRLPKTGDTIDIPKGITVIINDDEVISGSVYIKVEGILNFELNNSTLKMGAGTIEVAGGFINGGGSASQKIFIGNTIVFKGNEPSISGFQVASAAAPYFSWVNATPLPVTFKAFNVSYKSGNVLVQWSTATEVNSDHFEIERSFDGNAWSSVAQLHAAGTSQSVTNYSFTDRAIGSGIVYYRIKEVDSDGRIAFTSIQSIKLRDTEMIRIVSMSNNIVLQFPGAINNAVSVRIVSLAGQVLAERTISHPAGQVLVSTTMKGNYIVSVTNGRDINIAKQVVL